MHGSYTMHAMNNARAQFLMDRRKKREKRLKVLAKQIATHIDAEYPDAREETVKTVLEMLRTANVTFTDL